MSLSDFKTAITKEQVGIRFAVQISGIPYVFLDGAIPTGASGSAWAAPTSKGEAYTYLENSLDLNSSLSQVGQIVDRRSGKTSPGSFVLTFVGDSMLTLFARENAALHATNLTASVPFDSDGNGDVLTVEDNSNFPSFGYLYMGRETIKYNTKPSSTTFGDSGNKCVRDMFGIRNDPWGVSYTDIPYTHNENSPSKAPRVISNYPRVWHGRMVSVRAFCVGPEGIAFDDAFGESYSREIFRGIIQNEAKPDKTWQRWTLEARTVDSMLHTKVGSQTPTGSLLYQPSDNDPELSYFAKQEEDDANGPEWTGAMNSSNFLYWIGESNRDIMFKVRFWYGTGSLASYNAEVGGSFYDYTDSSVQLDTGLRSGQQIMNDFFAKVHAKGVTDGWSKTSSNHGITIGLQLANHTTMWGSDKDHVRVWCSKDTLDKGPYVHVEMIYNTPNNFGRMFAFPESNQIWVRAGKSKGKGAMPDPEGQMVGYIGPDASVIPFWLPNSNGVIEETIPSSGFARLGEDEIIEYTGLTEPGSSYSGSQTVEGMYILTGVKRGRMGTVPKAHELKVHKKKFTALGERAKVVFGIGLENVSLFDVFLQLAVSTGSGHHGSYDVLPSGWGVPLNPLDIDITEIEKIRDSTFAPHYVTLFLSKPVELIKLVRDWLAPLGLYITSHTNEDGQFLVTLAKVLPPLLSESAATSISTSDVDLYDPARVDDGIKRVINQINAKAGWSIVKEELEEHTKIIATDDDSVVDFGRRRELNWNFPGFIWSQGTAIQRVTSAAAKAFRRFARPYDVLKVNVSRAVGWNLKSGDAVQLTLPNFPTREGTRGFSSRAGVVLRADHSYWKPNGEVGTEVTVAVEDSYKTSGYVPSAKISGAVGTTITLADTNSFTPSNDKEIFHFSNNMIVNIYNEGSYSSGVDKRTLTNKNEGAGTFTINSPLSITVTSRTIMVFAGFDEGITSEQKQNSFIADTSTPPQLDGSTDSFKYT